MNEIYEHNLNYFSFYNFNWLNFSLYIRNFFCNIFLKYKIIKINIANFFQIYI